MLMYVTSPLIIDVQYMYLTMCILHSKIMAQCKPFFLIAKTVSVFLPLKHIEKQISLASEVCFSSLKLKFPVISGLKKNQSKCQEQFFIVNTECV